MLTQNLPESPFNRIRHYDKTNTEYWMARELMPMLGYQKWERFAGAIERSIAACNNSGGHPDQHFLPETGKSLTGRPGEDYKLSRYGCYLIAMNGDPRKAAIASAQSYFAIKTREAELAPVPQYKLPATYLEALETLVATEKQKLLLQAQNEDLQQENELLAEAVDELFDYSSVIRIAKFNDCSEKLFNWRELKTASKLLQLEVKQVPCPRFQTKNLYSHDAWRYVYPDARLPETTTLTISR